MPQTDDDAVALMTAAELKPLLRLSRRRPVSCAICMTKSNEGIVLMDRRMKPRRVLSQFRREAKENDLALNLPTLRFGRATVDGGSDSMRVTFTVNKLAPGAMARALLKQLRQAGYQRCEIVVDERLEEETDEDENAPDEEEAGSDEPDEPPAPAPEVATLRGELVGLVKELPAAIAQEPDRKQLLVGLAVEGQNHLKQGDVRAAGRDISHLKSALHPADKSDDPDEPSS